jgi:hypothetical protein
MQNPSQDKRKNESSKQPALFRWAWAWGVASTAAMLLCYWLGWKDFARALLAVTIVMLTISEIASRYDVTRKSKSGESQDTEPEEFYIHFPDPAESGWLNYTVIPSKSIYKEEICFGGPPVDISTYEYAVKGDHVFARLVDLREDDIYGKQYEVVNGQVLETEIRSRKPYDSTDGHIERLKKEVMWNETIGSLRYFILSKHECDLSIFSRERQRLDKGFASLAEKATQLGGMREPGSYYKAMNDADEESKAALRELQQTTRLERFGISFRELRDYEHIIQTLDGLISGSENQI